MRSALSIVFVGLGGLALVACGGSGSGDPYSGGNGGNGGSGGVALNCGTLADPPPDCQKSCTSDAQCEASFCANGSCLAQCTSEEGCAAGSTCNVSGRCVPDVGSGGTGGSGNTGGGGCQSVEVTPKRSIPNVMFLVDQSGSMDVAFGGGENRWEAAHSGINGIVSGIDSIVRFGLTTYTSRNGDDNPPCPRLPVAGDPLAASPRVDFGLGNSASISNDSIYPYTYPTDAGEDTPTGDSIDALVGSIQASPPRAEGPTIIVLATDGEPDSCEFPDPSNSTERDSARGEAVSASAGANAAGMDLFVLWVGELTSTSTRDHLQEVANVGVGLAADGSGGDAPFWVGDDPASLQSAFQQIISDSISCEIPINKPFNEFTLDQACNEGEVRLNETLLNCPSDWRVKDEPPYNVIELLGSACDTFKSGQVDFTAEFPCGTIVVE